MQIYKRFFKRPLDLFLALIAITLLILVFLLVAILVRINLGSPIIFKQNRPGMSEQIFTMYKFRTMTDERDTKGELLPNSVRLTNFGRFLRSTSLDELPELLNILKGDMSFIGPRPLVIEYLPYYTNEERTRHAVKPGLSGLAQINGRNIASWEQRFRYDIDYVNNITFLGDLKILVKTILKVIKRDDIGEIGVDAPMDFDQQRQGKFNNQANLPEKYSI